MSTLEAFTNIPLVFLYNQYMVNYSLSLSPQVNIETKETGHIFRGRRSCEMSSGSFEIFAARSRFIRETTFRIDETKGRETKRRRTSYSTSIIQS